jgi:hypothetical protein
MSIIWILLLAKSVYCAAAALPTLFFVRGGGWLKEKYRSRVEHSLACAASKLSGEFHPDENFFANGVGLAVDFSRRRFFVAERDGGRTEAAILPFSALRSVDSGEMNQNGFYDIYVELKVDDPKHPSWRLLLGENEALAGAVKATLGRLQAA